MSVLRRLSFGFGRTIPVILQTEVAECGLACLAMVARHHGYEVDLASLRRRFSASLKGITLDSMVRIASSLGLTTRALRLDLHELRNLRLPCVLHWDLRHFVVLERVATNHATIVDPARGRRRVPLSEFSSSFTGVALEAWPGSDFERQSKRQRLPLICLFRRIVGLKRALVQIVTLSLALEILGLIIPIGTQIIVDQAIVAGDLDLLSLIAIGLGLFLFVQTMVSVAQSWASLMLGTSLSVHWQIGLFDHLLRLPLDFFEKRHIGDIVSRFGSLTPIQTTLTAELVVTMLDVIVIFASAAMMVLFGGQLAAVALVSLGLDLILRLLAYVPYREANEAAIVHNAKEDTHFMETIRGIASIKALGICERRQNAWLNLLVDTINAGLRIKKLDLLFGTVATFVAGVEGIVTLWMGARAVIGGNMTTGMLIAFISYKGMFIVRSQSLIGFVIKLRMLNLHTERVADIALAEPEEMTRRDFATLVNPVRLGALCATDICFRYGDSEPFVLNGLSLSVSPGESLAITGASGSGKTTVLRIMAGLITPTSGTVSLGGQDIRQMGLSYYRSQIACVLQEDRLFAGSIAENIAVFDPQFDDKWVEECARIAAIDEDILKMPMGFETLVGDMGSALSRGQIQRLFLARALYRRPSILFLDEATSHLDSKSEATINNAVGALRIARVIVAHRQSTIDMADRQISLA